jgi:pseudouridine kinase
LTNRERQILKILEENPMIMQKDLASRLQITRSSVAVHIRNLTQKGYIKGKGYVLEQNHYVMIVGSSNVDIQGFSSNKVVGSDSNIGQIRVSMGGVGRNVTENLIRLGQETKLISVTGGDQNSTYLLNECNQIGIDTSHFMIVENKNASTYMAILDDQREMLLAINDMSIMDELTPEFIRSKNSYIKNSNILFLDTGLSTTIIDMIFAEYPKSNFFVDAVSVNRAPRIKKHLSKIHTLKCNVLEAAYLADMTIRTMKDAQKAADVLIKKGVKRIYITYGSKGVYRKCSYDDLQIGWVRAKADKIGSVTGAGDAFMAGVIYGTIKCMREDQIPKFATALSILTLEAEQTVNPQITYDRTYQKMKELF